MINKKKAPLTAGLTGGIASGKTTALGEFARLGASVIEADKIGHELMKSRPEIKDKLVKIFGGGILTGAGRIDRKKLGRIIFGDSVMRKKLEAVLHPEIISEIKRRIKILSKSSGTSLIVADVPLLFEAGLVELFDKVILVWVPKEVQIKRLRKRDKLSLEDIQLRLNAQWPIDKKIPLSDFVIDNSFSGAELRKKIETLWEVLTKFQKLV